MSNTTNTTATQRRSTDYEVYVGVGGFSIVRDGDDLVITMNNIVSSIFSWAASGIKSLVGRVTTATFTSEESRSNAQTSIKAQPASKILTRRTNNGSSSSSSVINPIEREIDELLDKHRINETGEPQINSKNSQPKLYQLIEKKDRIDREIDELEALQHRINGTTDAAWRNNSDAYQRLCTRLEKLGGKFVDRQPTGGEYFDVLCQIQNLEFNLSTPQ